MIELLPTSAKHSHSYEKGKQSTWQKSCVKVFILLLRGLSTGGQS